MDPVKLSPTEQPSSEPPLVSPDLQSLIDTLPTEVADQIFEFGIQFAFPPTDPHQYLKLSHDCNTIEVFASGKQHGAAGVDAGSTKPLFEACFSSITRAGSQVLSRIIPQMVFQFQTVQMAKTFLQQLKIHSTTVSEIHLEIPVNSESIHQLEQLFEDIANTQLRVKMYLFFDRFWKDRNDLHDTFKQYDIYRSVVGCRFAPQLEPHYYNEPDFNFQRVRGEKHYSFLVKHTLAAVNDMKLSNITPSIERYRTLSIHYRGYYGLSAKGDLNERLRRYSTWPRAALRGRGQRCVTKEDIR